jgi:hypothetical protein
MPVVSGAGELPSLTAFVNHLSYGKKKLGFHQIFHYHIQLTDCQKRAESWAQRYAKLTSSVNKN